MVTMMYIRKNFKTIVFTLIVVLLVGFYSYQKTPLNKLYIYENEAATEYINNLEFKYKRPNYSDFKLKSLIIHKEHKPYLKYFFIKRLILEHKYNLDDKYFTFKCIQMRKEEAIDTFLPKYHIDGKLIDITFQTIDVDGITVYYFDKENYKEELGDFYNPEWSSIVYVWAIDDVVYTIVDYFYDLMNPYNINHEEILEIIKTMN